jgi:hypothetical protein
MKNLALAFVLLSSVTSFADGAFPKTPDQTLTPGALCSTPDQKRYPEGIAYCSRDVGGDLKQKVMETYDSTLGYTITSMNRSLFKIDHFIPLCMGGSNQAENLWPQHASVYVITDPLEQVSCDKMAAGKLRQADAVEMIKHAKLNLADAPETLRHLRSL